jgi:thioredoxin-like negative regulator of GroEL
MTVRSATDHDFADAVLGAAGPVLVSFVDGGLVPPPVELDLEHLARESPWLTCVRLDANRWPLSPAAYRVTQLPALLVFVLGEPVLSITGRQSVEVVSRMIAALRPDPVA